MSGFRARGGGWVVGQFVLMGGAAVCGGVWHGQWLWPAGVALSVALFIAAVALGLLGAKALGRNLTPFPRPRAETSLVRHGVYGVVRHPLYTSVMFAAFGWALVRSSGPALTLAAALGLFFKAKADREERWLRERFPDYADYARHVRQLIPWVY